MRRLRSKGRISNIQWRKRTAETGHTGNEQHSMETRIHFLLSGALRVGFVFSSMSRADEIQTIRPGLFYWQVYDPKVKTDLSCCACETAKGLVLIDPIPLSKGAEAELLAVGTPRAIVLTSGNHARAAEAYRSRFSVPIYADPGAVGELPFAVDHTVSDGETLLDEFTVITLPGAAPGEMALHRGDALHFGDALIHLPSTGFAVLPDKYCDDPRELQRALQKLLRFSVELLTFAHGLPIVSRARQRLSQLLA
jgi:glyoxylase-like metal-dependent hydrolase (beta-lactamase superfamily II)